MHSLNVTSSRLEEGEARKLILEACNGNTQRRTRLFFPRFAVDFLTCARPGEHLAILKSTDGVAATAVVDAFDF